MLDAIRLVLPHSDTNYQVPVHGKVEDTWDVLYSKPCTETPTMANPLSFLAENGKDSEEGPL